MSYKNALITGSRGYIGSSLASAFKADDIATALVDKLAGESGQIVLNLSDQDGTKKLIRSAKPTTIIHCATNSALAYRDDFFTAFKEDFDSTYSLLSVISDLPECRVVYFSSSYVYSGISRDTKATEDTRLLPKHNFGIGKMFFEQYLLKNHPDSVIFRLSSVFGEGPSQHPNAILTLAKEAKESKKITVWGNGERMMQYVYLPDVAHAVLSADELRPGIYNLGGGEYVSVADTAKAIAKFFGAELVFLKDKPEGETLSFMETNKLREALPDNKTTLFGEALEEYLTKIKN